MPIKQPIKKKVSVKKVVYIAKNQWGTFLIEEGHIARYSGDKYRIYQYQLVGTVKVKTTTSIVK